jgi:Coenzyme PQQ synthesis protein D (PqqD)
MTQPVLVPDTVRKGCPYLGRQLTEVGESLMGSEFKRYVRNRDVVSRQIEGELVIVPIRRGVGDLNSLYTLNPVGSVLWDFLTEGHTLPEMVQRVCDEFEVTGNQAQSDIQEFLGSLLEEKLVQSLA